MVVIDGLGIYVGWDLFILFLVYLYIIFVVFYYFRFLFWLGLKFVFGVLLLFLLVLVSIFYGFKLKVVRVGSNLREYNVIEWGEDVCGESLEFFTLIFDMIRFF